MTPQMKERIAYGRSIRARAACLIDAHGELAQLEARIAAGDRDLTEADRLFWEAVAGRVARQSAAEAAYAV
jgi:hypothetical protein